MNPGEVEIQILHVPHCTLLTRARELVEGAVADAGVTGVSVECLVGDYPSPTVLVNGRDVTGADFVPGAACRLDLPTDDQLRIALSRAAMSTEIPT